MSGLRGEGKGSRQQISGAKLPAGSLEREIQLTVSALQFLLEPGGLVLAGEDVLSVRRKGMTVKAMTHLDLKTPSMSMVRLSPHSTVG